MESWAKTLTNSFEIQLGYLSGGIKKCKNLALGPNPWAQEDYLSYMPKSGF